MILVDTSVLIDYLKGRSGLKTDLFEEVLARNIPYGIAVYTYQEVLQGAKDKKEWDILKEYLASQIIYFPGTDLDLYEKAAKLFFDLRRKGITPRSSIDLLIVLIAVENNLLLLYNHRDFDQMTGQIKGFQSLEQI